MFRPFNFRLFRKRYNSTIWPHFMREFEASAGLIGTCSLWPEIASGCP